MKQRAKPVPSAGQLIRRSIAASVKRLFAHERGALGGNVEDVHQARVAVRRLRSDLRSFKRYVDKRWTMPLQQELDWLGFELGSMRDYDVLLERLRAAATALAPDGDGALARVLSAIDQERIQALGSVRITLRSRRYRDIRERLQATARASRFTQAARQAAREALPAIVRKRWKRLKRAVGSLSAHPSTRQLHHVRILAKRLRYATETSEPIGGRRSEQLADAAAALQDALGSLTDAEAACRALRRLRRKTDLAVGANALLAVETEAARRARSGWYACWRALDAKELRAWL